jgi:hypothetical protein
MEDTHEFSRRITLHVFQALGYRDRWRALVNSGKLSSVQITSDLSSSALLHGVSSHCGGGEDKCV